MHSSAKQQVDVRASQTCVVVVFFRNSSKWNECVFALVFSMDVSKHSGYKDFTWAVELNRLGLELIGLWPKNNDVPRNKFASDLRIVIIFVIVTFVSGIPLACSLIRVWGDMILMVDNIQITLPLLVVSLKLVIMRWKQTAMLSIIKMMAEDWMELRTVKERDVMIGRAQIARKIVIGGYVLMVLAFIMVIILPYFGLSLRHVTNLTDLGRPLPLQTYYFYDTHNSPQFELTYLIQAITIFLAAVTYTSVDAFLGLVILHLSGQLENFKDRVANLASYQNFIYTLSNNVMSHMRLIRFTNIIENIFTLMMLGLILYFSILFCLHGFLLLTVITEESDFSFARLCYPLISISILLSHAFLHCGAGEIVTMQCGKVYRAMCDLEWYKLEPKKARLLILLTMRTSQPLRITAGKILPLTMITFCSMLKTSAGYISFLLANRK
ncbi:odorant receptor 43a [Monomorium pharaonis]|uniref:odorant receptor 43a n=1 Tax=Monomorium pharaonis TaxID=307658 RepID=UPI0017462B67|nr:odorant receptor 43a [Monomorium pharaonis]